MKLSDKPLVDSLRTYCQTKRGATEELSTYHTMRTRYYLVTHWFRDYFAIFELDKAPARLVVRCEDEHLKRLQATYPAKIEPIQSKSDKQSAEILLDGSIPDKELYQLIDSSYTLVFNDLSKHGKLLVSLTDPKLTTDNLLDKLMDFYELSHRRSQVRELPRPAIYLTTCAVDEETMPLGQSKIGGVPDLPEGWDWPTFDDKPLAFLAQINLSEIPDTFERENLPKSGILYFFSGYGWQLDDGDLHPDVDWRHSHEAGFSQVLFLPDTHLPLNRRSKPIGFRTFNSTAVEYSSALSMPDAEEFRRTQVVEALGWTEDDYEFLNEFCSDFECVNHHISAVAGYHQLLGYEKPIQSAIAGSDQQVLFQVVSDHRVDMDWFDGGIIYFVIRRDDLQRQDFSNIMSDCQFT